MSLLSTLSYSSHSLTCWSCSMTATFASLSVSGNPFCPSSSSFEDNGTSETHWWRFLLLSSSSPTSRFSVCLWTSLCLCCSMTSTATHCLSSTSSTRETCPSWAHNTCPMPAWPSSFSSPSPQKKQVTCVLLIMLKDYLMSNVLETVNRGGYDSLQP